MDTIYDESRLEVWIVSIQKGSPGSLSNTSLLCEALENPQDRFNSIHIAGTNGKGSVVKKCSAVLEESGYTVGMFISPHIFHYTERIQINMQPIPQNLFFHYSNIIKSCSESLNLQIGWFDLYSVVCFLYFAEQKVDWACIEVGLGGRLDNTNVLKPKLTIIVSISLDHTEILGNTLEQIAYEKAGIIKNFTPCVYGPTVPESIILEICGTKQAVPMKACLADGFYTYDQENSVIAATALDALKTLGFRIDAEAFRQLRTRQPCRMQEFIVGEKTVICDVAHNPAGISRTLDEILWKFGNDICILGVVGMSKGKMIKECISIIKERVSQLYLVRGNSPKLAEIEELSCFAGNKVCGSGNINIILERLLREKIHGVLLITGSFYLMDEACATIHKIQTEINQ